MRMKFQCVLFLFSFFLLIQCCYAQKRTVTGKVQGINGALQGATVFAGSITALTDTAGEFSIMLSPGNYVLHISHSGYRKISQEMHVDAGKDISLQFSMSPDEMLEEVTVLGSRFSMQRSNLSTPVPVDVISSAQLLQTAQTSLTQMLQFSIPSFNASRQLVNEHVTLRGLDPDQVLILVNGKRYHNTAFVNWGGVRGILGRGSVSNDLNSIPFSAMEKVEILRDGASAQYGSDAIAGVINIQLKKSVGKTWATLHTGQFYKSDGKSISVGINRGVTFLKKGSLNFSATYRFQNPTYRGGKYLGTVYKNFPLNADHTDSIQTIAQDDSIVNAKKFDRNKVSNAGSSKHNSFGFSINGDYPLGKKAELFWTAIVNHRSTVFTSGFTLPKNSNRINPELFPNGYKPRPGNYTNDIYSIVGVNGEFRKNWKWEISNTYGNNRGKYDNKETNNASQFYTLGKNAPTTFYTGSLVYGQLINDIHMSKNFSVNPEKIVNLGFGVEWRLENFQIKEGEEASWKNYNPTGNKLGGSGGFVLSPYDAINENRNVTAAYVEIESEYAGRFLLGMAGRYEYYSDFGGNLAGKLAARYKINEKISVRSSISNGFRAPSLQQLYMSFTRLALSNINGVSVIATQGIFRNNSGVANTLGIPSLQAERSVNFGGGLTASLHQHIRLTIDAYWIQIKNRIVLSGIFDRRDNQDVNTLLNGLTDVNQVQFFTNAINTKTKGVDIVLNGNWKIERANLQLMLAANFTQTKLFGEIKKAGNLKTDSLNSNTLFSTEEKTKLEEGQPSDKIILSGTYLSGKTKLIIRNTRFGKTAIAPAFKHPATGFTTFLYESFLPKILTDISLGHSPKKWLTFTFGANNIFDVYPDRIKDYRNTGEGMFTYGQEATPFGFNGGYYFLSMELKW